MGDYPPDKKAGCVSMIYGGIFRRRGFWPRRTASAPTSPVHGGVKGSPLSKRRRGGFDDAVIVEGDREQIPVRQTGKPVMNHPKNSPYQYQNQGFKPYHNMPRTPPTQGVGQGRKVPKESTGISGELEIMINDYQHSKGSSTLLRASSGNVMLYGNLGNLKKPGAANSNPRNEIFDYLPMTAQEKAKNQYEKHNDGNFVASNVARKASERVRQPTETKPSLCRVVSTRMDPEQLKLMGNEDFKEGRFAEALALYEAAIAIDPEKAAYRSNKSAALTALGRLLEAVFECREAIKIEPTYHRAHNRLATLYLRLGEAEKALYHYKHSGPEADPNSVAQAKKLVTHLSKCTEARRRRDWNTLLKVTDLVISSGADSALQIFALQAEALLKLQRHEEADAALAKGPQFNLHDCTKYFGPDAHASILVTQAQVSLAAGRFDEAMEIAQRAAQLDSNNKEVNSIVGKAKGVAAARSRGNNLFKASKFLDACSAYGQGLEHDPFNSVLLCNRAACRSKLGQFEKAVEDCTKALSLRPSYSKARLRRADCNAKLERWESALEDYEVLIKETPENEEVQRALSEVQTQLRKQRPEDSKEVKSSQNTAAAPSKDHFKNVVSSSGTSVVLFCNKLCDKYETQLIEQLSRRYRSVKFLKVDVDDHPHVAMSEEIDSLPTFRIYKNGSRVKDVTDTDQELLENSINHYCS